MTKFEAQDTLNMSEITCSHPGYHGTQNSKFLSWEELTSHQKKAIMDAAEILKRFCHKGCSIILPKYFPFGLFPLVLLISSTVHQEACCYAVWTSQIHQHYVAHQYTEARTNA